MSHIANRKQSETAAAQVLKSPRWFPVGISCEVDYEPAYFGTRRRKTVKKMARPGRLELPTLCLGGNNEETHRRIAKDNQARGAPERDHRRAPRACADRQAEEVTMPGDGAAQETRTESHAS